MARGSGTFVGISTLLESIRGLGYAVDLVTPGFRLWPYTASRLWFNQCLRFARNHADITVGFDLDGYTIAGKSAGQHIAALKGVIADEARFERGFARATMRLQASREKLHARRADLVLTTSRYSAQQIARLYGVEEKVRIVPEGIDLHRWQRLLAQNPGGRAAGKFVVLCVCRFYRRKRVNILLGAAARLRSEIPILEIRIVGDGPEAARLHQLARTLQLEETVVWLRQLAADELTREYSAADVFCMPSVQEGFGIVFLEAMAAGLPIVAANAAAVPEVVRHGLLAAPESDEELAHAIMQLYRQPQLRRALAERGQEDVRQYDAAIVARQFLSAIGAGADPQK